MNISIEIQSRIYTFDITLFRDEDQELFYFLILSKENVFMLAKKENPGGKWSQVSGGAFAADLQDAIFDKIDNISVAELLSTERPISELDKQYINRL